MFNFSEDLTIEEIKDKLFEYYSLVDLERENNMNNVSGIVSQKNLVRKKLIRKRIKKFVYELIQDLNDNKAENIIFGDIRKINNLFFHEEN